ncbi:hypothetical protein [Burkholderia gladioli]|uniref:hypothetical protein n=1 Tax=Burkholderia gladioli TaxID=28095 RepID=UPI001C5EEEE4|nr:hypothetical protein [Burkholderia gladioli]MBW5287153.1 hypothetical protein [Burkholderia gladioli]
MTKKFTHNGKEFEIRKAVIGDEHCVRVYQDNKQVSPTYSVSQEIESDYRTQTGKSMVEELEQTAQSDIERGLYIS